MKHTKLRHKEILEILDAAFAKLVTFALKTFSAFLSETPYAVL